MTSRSAGAIAVFESIGSRGEAPMRNHVNGVDRRKHNIVLSSHDVVLSQAQMEMYGGRRRLLDPGRIKCPIS
jgi:hypothetical protein